MGLFTQTLQGLVVPRRAIPIAVVCIPMTILEERFSGAMGVIVALGIFTGFLLIGPATYRALLPARDDLDHKLLRFLGFVLVAFVYVFAFGVLLPRIVGVSWSILTDPVTLYSAAPLFWAGSWALGRDMEWEANLLASQARNQALEREAQRAQLLALRTHLDPHFLFNTLNAIAEWCREDPAVAERATLQLSKMLRTMLTGVKAPSWPLAQELELVHGLLDLHHARDPQRFTYTLDVDPDCTRIPVPPLLVLPLVENALKHGPAAGHAGAIEIRCRPLDAGLELTVSNPGPYAGPRQGGEGIPTAQLRLQLAYDGRASMTIQAEGTRTLARLKLPAAPSGEAV